MDEEIDITATAESGETTEESPTSEAQPTDGERSGSPKEGEEAGTPKQEEEENHQPSGAEKRIRELTARTRRAEEDAAYWRGVAEGKGGDKEAQPKKEETPPRPDDFENYDDYLVARAKFEIRQEMRQEATQSRAATSSAEMEKEWNKRLTAAAADHPEIYEVINDSTLPISPAMAMVIKDSDRGTDLVLYFNENRADAERIYNMTPIGAARAIGAIESKLPAKAASAPPPPRKSNAPPPVRTVTPRATPETDLDNVPMSEFMARRNKEQFGGK